MSHPRAVLLVLLAAVLLVISVRMVGWFFRRRP